MNETRPVSIWQMRCAVLVATASGALAINAAAQQATIETMPFRPWVVSASGDVVAVTNHSGREPALWFPEADTLVPIVYAAGYESHQLIPMGMSEGDTTVVGNLVAPTGRKRAFRWSQANGMQLLCQPPDGANDIDAESWAGGISDDGAVVGSCSISITWLDEESDERTDIVRVPHVWNADGSIDTLDTITYDGSGGRPVSRTASGTISRDGTTVVGSYTVGSTTTAASWTNLQGPVSLGPWIHDSFYATEVSSDGSVIAGNNGFCCSVADGFVWNAETGYTTIGYLEGGNTRSEIHDMNDDGSVVVGWSDTGLGTAAVVWTPVDGLRHLNDLLVEDFALDSAPALNNAIAISGDGTTILVSGAFDGGSQYGIIKLPCAPGENCCVVAGNGGNESVGSGKSSETPSDACTCVLSEWKAAVSGSFEDADMWTSDEKPLANNCITFDNEGIYSVAFSDDEHTGTLTIGHDEVTLQLNQHTLSVYGPISELVPIPSLVIAGEADQVGRLTVTGGTLVAENSIVTIGNGSGFGELTIQNGGAVRLPTGNGVFADIAVEDGATASVLVESGATLETGYVTDIAKGAGSQAAMEVTGEGSAWAAATVVLGTNGSAELVVADKATVTFNDLRLAVGAGGVSTAMVSGAETTFSSGPDGILSIAEAGTATFLVDGGASVFQEGTPTTQLGVDVGGDGELRITDGTTWVSTGQLVPGVQGRGRVRIDTGSTVEFVRMEMALFTGSPEEAPDNFVEVDGPGTTFALIGEAYDGLVGRSGNGRLSVTNDAHFTAAGNVVVGGPPIDGTAPLGDTRALFELSGTESLATIGGILAIGDQHRGMVEISNGANVYASEIHVGWFGTAENVMNTLTIDGAGSAAGAPDAWVGVEAPGTVNLTNGGAFVASYLELGGEGTLNGTVMALGGSPNTAPAMSGKNDTDGNNAPNSRGEGFFTDTLIVASTAELNVSAIEITSGGVLGGSGSMSIPIVNAGTVSPGTDSTTVAQSFLFGYTQAASGNLVVDVGSSDSDRIDVTGTAILGGTLRVRTLPEYDSAEDRSFIIVMADSIDGSFSTVVVESSTGDTAKASVEYTDVSVSITVDAVVVGNDELDSVISTWAIGQNFPNPFVGRSTVPFSIPENAEVEFRVFDLLGRQVVRRNLGVLLPGRHAAVVNLENESSGVYLFELQAFSAGRRHFRESVGLVVMN